MRIWHKDFKQLLSITKPCDLQDFLTLKKQCNKKHMQKVNFLHVENNRSWDWEQLLGLKKSEKVCPLQYYVITWDPIYFGQSMFVNFRIQKCRLFEAKVVEDIRKEIDNFTTRRFQIYIIQLYSRSIFESWWMIQLAKKILIVISSVLKGFVQLLIALSQRCLRDT